MALGRLLPAGPGYRLAEALADRLSARRQSDIVRAVRANQWVASQGALSAAQLDAAVRDTFRHAARCLYDLYHNLYDTAALESLLTDDNMQRQLARVRAQKGTNGVIVVGPHLSNFDLVGRVAARQGLQAQVITFPDPGGGYRWQNDLRRQFGLDITPASRQAIKQAIQELEAGGVVVSGIDRPIPGGKHRPPFFGRPAAVPLIHVTLAQRTGAPIIVAAVRREADGRYRTLVSEPYTLQSHPDRRTELLLNGESLLCIAEEYIREAPRQWLMFYPVWPEASAEMP